MKTRFRYSKNNYNKKSFLKFKDWSDKRYTLWVNPIELNLNRIKFSPANDIIERGIVRCALDYRDFLLKVARLSDELSLVIRLDYWVQYGYSEKDAKVVY